jgi:hypothetical protein
METSAPTTKYPVLLLIPAKDMNEDAIKQVIQDSGLHARYNVGPIPQSLPKTFAPLGRMVFPISMQDSVFDPLDECNYSDFDISKYWNRNDRKDIEVNGPSEHLMAALYASMSDLESLDSALNGEEVYVWHWHQWVLISRLNRMHWAY